MCDLVQEMTTSDLDIVPWLYEGRPRSLTLAIPLPTYLHPFYIPTVAKLVFFSFLRS